MQESGTEHCILLVKARLSSLGSLDSVLAEEQQDAKSPTTGKHAFCCYTSPSEVIVDHCDALLFCYCNCV